VRSFRFVVLGSVIALFLASMPVALADNVTARSAPNGDVVVISSSGTSTNKDKDGNFNTLTQADGLGLLYAVANNTDAAQTAHITVDLDGPGTAQDATLVDEDVVLGPNCPQDGSLCEDIEQNRFEFQIKRKDWPAGSYSLSVTGSGTESATAVSTFTVAY
jgi:hypothetical protein